MWCGGVGSRESKKLKKEEEEESNFSKTFLLLFFFFSTGKMANFRGLLPLSSSASLGGTQAATPSTTATGNQDDFPLVAVVEADRFVTDFQSLVDQLTRGYLSSLDSPVLLLLPLLLLLQCQSLSLENAELDEKLRGEEAVAMTLRGELEQGVVSALQIAPPFRHHSRIQSPLPNLVFRFCSPGRDAAD